MSQLTPRSARSRANYTGLTCLFLVAVGYVGIHAQLLPSSTGQPASALSVRPDITQAILAATSASQTAADTPDPSNVPNANASTDKSAASEQTTSDNNTNLQVTVNGQTIDVPANGSVNQTIPNETGNGQTSISISNSQSSNGTSTGYSYSSTHSNDSSSSSSVRFSTEHTNP